MDAKSARIKLTNITIFFRGLNLSLSIDIDSGKLVFSRFEISKKKKKGKEEKDYKWRDEIKGRSKGRFIIFSLRRNLLQITCNSQTRIFFLTSDQSLFYVASFGARYKGYTKFRPNYQFSHIVGQFSFLKISR